MIEVAEVEADAGSAGEIAAFLEGHRAATAYAMPAWLVAMRRFMGARARYLVARRGDRIAGVLPVAERPAHPSVAALPASFLSFLSFLPMRESLGGDCYGGPLVASDLDDDGAARVIDALVQRFVAGPALLATLFLPAWLDLRPLQRRIEEAHGFRPMHGYPMAVKDLAGLTPATLAATYHKKTRNAVVAAKNRGVEVVRAQGVGDLLEFWDLLEETMEHGGIGSKFPKDFVVEGGQGIIAAGVGDLWLARVERVPVAGMFVLHTARTTCWWLGAAARDEKAQQHRPMNAVVHAAMVDAIVRGDDHFEMGGLTVEGIRAFKLRWGVREYEQVTYERSFLGLADRIREARALASSAGARLRRARG